MGAFPPSWLQDHPFCVVHFQFTDPNVPSSWFNATCIVFRLGADGLVKIDRMDYSRKISAWDSSFMLYLKEEQVYPYAVIARNQDCLKESEDEQDRQCFSARFDELIQKHDAFVIVDSTIELRVLASLTNPDTGYALYSMDVMRSVLLPISSQRLPVRAKDTYLANTDTKNMAEYAVSLMQCHRDLLDANANRMSNSGTSFHGVMLSGAVGFLMSMTSIGLLVSGLRAIWR